MGPALCTETLCRKTGQDLEIEDHLETWALGSIRHTGNIEGLSPMDILGLTGKRKELIQ